MGRLPANAGGVEVPEVHINPVISHKLGIGNDLTHALSAVPHLGLSCGNELYAPQGARSSQQKNVSDESREENDPEQENCGGHLEIRVEEDAFFSAHPLQGAGILNDHGD